MLLDRSPARALLLDTVTGLRPYATFADLAPCLPLQTAELLADAGDREPANYAAWGPDGSLYVTDYLQGVVWRVPPGGGAAQIWLPDRGSTAASSAPPASRSRPTGATLLIGQGSRPAWATATRPPARSTRSRSAPTAQPGDMRQLWESGPTDLPDGFGVARPGGSTCRWPARPTRSPWSAPDGTEVERFPTHPAAATTAPVPFDTPSSARFLGTRLIVANQSFTGDRDNQALLDVEVGEPGLTELIPGRDTKRPRLSKRLTVPKARASRTPTAGSECASR